MGDHTVAQSACGTSPVLSVNARASVIEAFTIMVANDIMGVAVSLREGDTESRIVCGDVLLQG